MTTKTPEAQYRATMARNGAHSRGGIGKERKAALARATEKPPAPREDRQTLHDGVAAAADQTRGARD